MIEDIIKLETAKLAKKKGFPQHVSAEDVIKGTLSDIDMYYPDGRIRGYWFNPYDYETFRAATQALVEQWLSDTLEIDIDINRGGVSTDWYAGYRRFGYGYIRLPGTFTSRKEAKEMCLVAALNSLPDK